MAIRAIITVDDDRWAKHPYGVKFDNEECNSRFHRNGLDDREACFRVIAQAKVAGYDIDNNVEEVFY